MIPWLACRAFRSPLPRAFVSVCFRHAQPGELSASEVVLHCGSPAWVPVTCLGSLHASYSTPAATAAATTAPIAAAATASTSVPTPASATPQFKVGYVYDARVEAVYPRGVVLNLGVVNVFRRPMDMSNAATKDTDLTQVFKINEQIKVLVTGVNTRTNHPWVYTKHLETTPGQVLKDKAAVWAGAEKAAEKYRIEGAGMKAKRQKFLDSLKEGDQVEATLVGMKSGWRALFLVNGEHTVSMTWTAASADGLSIGDKVKLVVSSRLPTGYVELKRVVDGE